MLKISYYIVWLVLWDGQGKGETGWGFFVIIIIGWGFGIIFGNWREKELWEGS
jgi:hypothetical protein